MFGRACLRPRRPRTLTLNDAAFELRFHDLRSPTSEFQKPREQQEQRFASNDWFGAAPGELRSTNQRGWE
jgi:hypothetical protein